MRSFRSCIWPGLVLALLLLASCNLQKNEPMAPTVKPATASAPTVASPPRALATATATAKPGTSTATAPAPRPTATPRPAHGHTYFVNSVTGSDSNSGDSPATAWRNLDKINDRTFAGGDVINLARGSDWTGKSGTSATLELKGAGAPGELITLQAYGTGPAPILRNPDPEANSRILVVHAPYALVRDLVLTDAHEIGLYVAQTADHSTIRNIEVSKTGIGIRVDARWVLITDNEVNNLHMVVDATGGNVSYGAQCILVEGPNNEIAYNHLINCSAPSHEYGTDGAAVEFYGNVDNTLVHHNYSFNTPSFNEVGGGSAHNVVVAHNIMVQSGQVEVLHLKGPFSTTIDNFQFINNTVYDASQSGAISLFFIEGQVSGPGAFIVRNNIFAVKNYSMALQGDSPFTHDHNLYYLMNNTMNINYDLGPGERLGDPLFVDPMTGDFSLKAGSPAIDSGAAVHFASSIAPAVSDGAAPPNLGAAHQ